MALKTENENGAIIIQNDVLAKIAGMAATHCYGVVGMVTRKKTTGLVNLLFGDSMAKGVSVTTTEDAKLAIDLHIMVEYGVNIAAICEAIIKDVKYNVEMMTGFKVGKVNVNVESARVTD